MSTLARSLREWSEPLMFWIAALLATWVAMHIIFRYEVGAEKAAEIRKEKNGFQRFFYIGYAKYVKEKPVAFFILRWQFYLGILALLLFLLACIENFLRATEVYAFIAMGMLAIAALASSGVDNSKDKNGEQAEVVDARVAWHRSWEKFQQAKKNWDERGKQLSHREESRLINKLESKACLAEEHWRNYYAVCRPNDVEGLEHTLQQLQDVFCLIDRVRRELGEEKESSFITADTLLPYDEPFRKNYQQAKERLHQANGEEQADCLAEMLKETDRYIDNMTDRWLANMEIRREIGDELKESRKLIFAQLDEIEALQKQIQAPELDEELKETYHIMYVNGILPPEREEHFPDAIHQGEIHRFYN